MASDPAYAEIREQLATQFANGWQGAAAAVRWEQAVVFAEI